MDHIYNALSYARFGRGQGVLYHGIRCRRSDRWWYKIPQNQVLDIFYEILDLVYQMTNSGRSRCIYNCIGLGLFLKIHEGPCSLKNTNRTQVVLSAAMFTLSLDCLRYATCSCKVNAREVFKLHVSVSSSWHTQLTTSLTLLSLSYQTPQHTLPSLSWTSRYCSS